MQLATASLNFNYDHHSTAKWPQSGSIGYQIGPSNANPPYLIDALRIVCGIAIKGFVAPIYLCDANQPATCCQFDRSLLSSSGTLMAAFDALVQRSQKVDTVDSVAIA